MTKPVVYRRLQFGFRVASKSVLESPQGATEPALGGQRPSQTCIRPGIVGQQLNQVPEVDGGSSEGASSGVQCTQALRGGDQRAVHRQGLLFTVDGCQQCGRWQSPERAASRIIEDPAGALMPLDGVGTREAATAGHPADQQHEDGSPAPHRMVCPSVRV